jgi:hypothetical protein
MAASMAGKTSSPLRIQVQLIPAADDIVAAYAVDNAEANQQRLDWRATLQSQKMSKVES